MQHHLYNIMARNTQRKLNHEEIAGKPQMEKHSSKNKKVGLENYCFEELYSSKKAVL